MSSHLWKYYLEDDVDRFRHLLETAAYNVRNPAQKGGGGGHNTSSGSAIVGSPGTFGTSPTVNTRGRKSSGWGQAGTPGSGHGAVSLTRADVNWRDSNGLTILHHASSSTSETSSIFAQSLIDHPLTDLYLQDLENGWTALHRAFYFGNITIARSILERDAENALGRAIGGASHNVLGLIKIKDREGHGPLDLYAATIQDRTLRPEGPARSRAGSNAESETDHTSGDVEDGDEDARRKSSISCINIGGDDCVTFGSNRNITLGFGDEDDRQHPERITLRRPDHLLQRFHREHLEEHENKWAAFDNALTENARPGRAHNLPVDALPWIIKSRPLVIQDVHMAKLHTAVLTTDPESNLYMCGHGPGGRLGTGHERTQFTFACIEGGALSGKKTATVALGQNHTLALSTEGELFSWGSNGYGQLGYSLPKTALKDEDPIQTLPRQIFGPLKRELVIGIAASRIHSVAYTSSSLYTWGKNEGQLGLVDSDARSLETQVTPRKVAASLFASAIASVSAIDKATICLLTGSHDCWVFANYGYAKIQFPLDGFTNYFLKQSFLITKYDNTANHICKVTSGGDTVCALSSSGEVYSLSVSQPQAMQSANASTTNPSKIRGALSQPHCIWSLKKGNMAARDVGVDADGSIILTTEEGSVWKRSRRAKIRDAAASGSSEYKPKDYKFSRISGLTRVIGVRSSGYGAYAAIRRDCNVTKTQVAVEDYTLWKDLLPLLCFRNLKRPEPEEDSESEEPAPRFWQGRKRPNDVVLLRQQLLESKDLEAELSTLLRSSNSSALEHDAFVGSTVSDIRLPVHQFVLAARSRALREGLFGLHQGSDFTIPELLHCELDDNKRVTLIFQGLDILTLANFVLYCHTDTVVDYWHHTRRAPKLAFRYRQTRTELMKVAIGLRMARLEPAVRQMVEPTRSLHMDMELATKDSTFFDSSDVRVELADDEILVHSALVCQRCPFFQGLFAGRAGGRWLEERRGQLNGKSKAVTVDLKHIESGVFRIVLRYLYADSGEELFDDTVTANLDDFLDLVMEVMGVANELMLDRLSQICQKVIGRHVNVRNVCSLLNAIAPSSVTEFKDASLEYMCLSLESMLHGGLLDELDEDLLLELDDVVRDNQLACMPFAKSGRAEALLHERNPDLSARLEQDRQAKIDSISLHSKYQDMDRWTSSSYRAYSLDENLASPSVTKARRKSSHHGRSGAPSPALKGKAAVQELGTSINEDSMIDLGIPALQISDPQELRSHARDTLIGSPPMDVWYDSKGKQLSAANGTSGEQTPTRQPGALSPRIAPLPGIPTISSAAPWASTPTPPPGAKLEMKDIMAQASGNRVSNLSLGLAASSQKAVADVSLAPKMSQKERKKLQQQHPNNALSPLSSSPASKSSPWQIASGQKVPSLKDVLGDKQPTQSVSPHAPASRSPSMPQLTMRQTIANKPSSAPKNIIGPGTQSPSTQRAISGTKPASQPLAASPRPTASPQQARKPSVTAAVSPGPSKPAANPASMTDFPTIQSIRHQPRPVEPSLQLSMSDILSQQQAEKDIIREAAAKRNLQDIQAEQEFQEWWDKEAARMREEEGEGGQGQGKVGGRGASGAGSKRGGRRGGGAAGRGEKQGPSSQGQKRGGRGGGGAQKGGAANVVGVEGSRGR